MKQFVTDTTFTPDRLKASRSVTLWFVDLFSMPSAFRDFKTPMCSKNDLVLKLNMTTHNADNFVLRSICSQRKKVLYVSVSRRLRTKLKRVVSGCEHQKINTCKNLVVLLRFKADCGPDDDPLFSNFHTYRAKAVTGVRDPFFMLWILKNDG